MVNLRAAMIVSLMAVQWIGSIAVNRTAEMKMIEAARDGHMDRFESIINANPDLDVNSCHVIGVGHQTMTALMIASSNGHNIVNRLSFLRPDLKMNQVNSDGQTALHFAAQGGHTAIVESLIAIRKVNVNAEDVLGQTALHRATRDHVGVVKALLTRVDLDINLSAHFGWTALMFAIIWSSVEVINVLLTSDLIRTDIVNNRKWTAETMALENDAIWSVLQQLPLYNAVTDNTGEEQLLLKAVRIGNDTAVREMMSMKPTVDINAVNCNGWTSLMIACFRGYIPIVKLLLDRKDLKVNFWNGNRRSALTLAVETYREDVVTMIINSGHYVHLRETDSKGRTALMIARHLRYDDIASRIATHLSEQITVISNIETVLNASMPQMDSTNHVQRIAQFLLGVNRRFDL